MGGGPPLHREKFQSLCISILNDYNSLFIGDLQQTWIHTLEPVLSIPYLKAILSSLHPTVYDFDSTFEIPSNWFPPNSFNALGGDDITIAHTSARRIRS
jgi:hypothetical protein